MRDLGVEFVTEKSFDDLRGVRGGPLRFDFAIRDGLRYLLIEYDGEGHFGPVRFGDMSHYEAVRAFDRTVEHDRHKSDFVGLMVIRSFAFRSGRRVKQDTS